MAGTSVFGVTMVNGGSVTSGGTLGTVIVNHGTFASAGVTGAVSNVGGTVNHTEGTIASLAQTAGTTTILGTAATISGLADIQGGAFLVNAAASLQAIGGLEISAGATGQIFGALAGNVGNAGQTDIGTTITGDFSNSGTLNSSNAATVTGALDNSGTVTIADGDTLSVGSYVARSGSQTQFGLSEKTAARVSATTTADIQSGADIAIDVATDAVITGGQTYTLVSTGGGVAMDGSLSDNSALYNFISEVSGNDLVLTAVRVLDLSTLVSDRNLDEAANALDTLFNCAGGADLSTALGILQTDQDVRTALEEIAPEDDFYQPRVWFGFVSQTNEIALSRARAESSPVVSRDASAVVSASSPSTAVIPWVQLATRRQTMDPSSTLCGYSSRVSQGSLGLDMRSSGQAAYRVA